MEKLKCEHCGVELRFLTREKIQLGQTSLLLGDWGNLLAGALDTAIFTCPTCGKLEFFQGSFYSGEGEEAGEMAKTRCPRCGIRYELDYPKCPRCGLKNETW